MATTRYQKGVRAKSWNGFRPGSIPWNKGLVGRQAGQDSPNWKGGLPSCLECDTQLSQRHPKTSLCRSCYWKSEKAQTLAFSHLPAPRRGDKNHNWKGGVRGYDYIERRRFTATMQKSIFERDGYKCLMCRKGGDLQVEHIAKWSEQPSLRFVSGNCVTLCKKCHYLRTFGREMVRDMPWGHNFGRRIAT